jgi:hypothetical protein
LTQFSTKAWFKSQPSLDLILNQAWFGFQPSLGFVLNQALCFLNWLSATFSGNTLNVWE